MRQLFATPLYEADLADDRGWAGLAAELLEACGMLAEEDAAGRAWCRENGYAGYTSYASLDDLPRRVSAFADLKRLLDRHARRFADALAFDLGAGRLRLDSLWVNVLKSGGVHTGHIHPHSVISGTVYLAVPAGAGAIRFEDPRLSMMMAAPTRREDAPEALQPFVYVQPQAGGLIMWESWLRHEVAPNRARSERVSVSFNYGWR